jgi:hypothetical protein
MKNFRHINFGYASAEQEGSRAPDLLLVGYFDLHDVCRRALESNEFLVLGYKGSGKTAIAERLKLLYEQDSQVFITNVNLEDFPYSTFSQLIKENLAPESKYPTAWSWILLIYLLASLEKDAGLRASEPGSFDETLLALREMGLLPVTGLQRLIRTTTKRTFKLSIPKFFEGSWERQDSRIDIPNYVDNLKRLITELCTDSKHIIILDGLDEIVTSEAAQWSSLGALIFEVNRLNALFARNNVSAKILLLCRTDIFELIAGANKNKIRQDSALELNWYADSRAPSQSLLVKVANMRATLAFGSETELFREFFPRKVFSRQTTRKTLLETTRHTPRDFLQLLKYIQGYCTGPTVTSANVRSGIQRYSTEYFLPEIVDELEGYATASETKEFFQMVGSLRSRIFKVGQIYELLNKDSKALTQDKVDIILGALFECSAVGNIQQNARGQRFYTFRFRNRHATFNLKEPIILHRGLWRALNIPSDPNWDL